MLRKEIWQYCEEDKTILNVTILFLALSDENSPTNQAVHLNKAKYNICAKDNLLTIGFLVCQKLPKLC